MENKDNLRVLAGRIATLLESNARPLVRGLVSTSEPAFVEIYDDDSFTNALGPLLSNREILFAVEETEFDNDMLESAAKAAGPDSAEDSKAVHNARAHVGHVAIVVVHLLHIAALNHIILRRSAPWYDELPTPEDVEESDEGDDRTEYGLFGGGTSIQERERMPDVEVKRLARLVAETEAFQSSSTAMMQRRSATEAALDSINEDVPDHEVSRVSQEAGKLWDFDIRPRLNAALRPRAVELLNQGMAKAKIAAAIGVPVKRLAEIL